MISLSLDPIYLVFQLLHMGEAPKEAQYQLTSPGAESFPYAELLELNLTPYNII